MFGELRGAAAAITGNTFTAVTLLWMGRVKRGGKSSQVHRKVMIQTVYNRISPPTLRDHLSSSSSAVFTLTDVPFSPSLSNPLPFSLSPFHLERQPSLAALSTTPPALAFLMGPPWFSYNENTFMTSDAVAPRVHRSAIRIRGWVSFEALPSLI